MAETESTEERIEPGARLAGRYRLDAIVGAGGMAVVWRAHDEALGRAVAIKVMSDALAASPAYVARFGREARIAAGISHPNLVTVYDFSATAERPYLVMPFLEGGTLEQRLARGRLDGPAAVTLARELLSALAAVHGRGVVHRDVKPANVLLDAGGSAKLTDFGVARVADATALTQPGHVVGTLRFLAPELTRGAPPTVASDLFALGVLLSDAVPNPAPAPLDELIDTLTREDPAERPADAASALARLEVPAPGEPVAAPPPRADTDPTRPLELDATRPLRVPAGASSETAPTRIAPPQPQPRAVPSSRSTRRRGLAGTVLALLLVLMAISGAGHPGHRTPAGAGGSGASTGTGTAQPDGVGRLSLTRRLDQLRREIAAAPSR